MATTASPTPTPPPLFSLHTLLDTNQINDPIQPGTYTPPPSPFTSLMRHYFNLHLRADQARTLMHSQLQHNRYQDFVHGPPYERIEHWSRCLATAKLEFEDTESRWREGGLCEGGEGRSEGVRLIDGGEKGKRKGGEELGIDGLKFRGLKFRGLKHMAMDKEGVGIEVEEVRRRMEGLEGLLEEIKGRG